MQTVSSAWTTGSSPVVTIYVIVMAGLVPAIPIILEGRARLSEMPATSMTNHVIAGLDPAIHAAAPNMKSWPGLSRPSRSFSKAVPA
jgi:hypothetical protein